MVEVTNPLISCVVIGYNIEKYIEECISSVLKQSYQNFEVIFVDDGSKDRTLELVRNIADDRLKVYSKKNGGIISARVHGVQHSFGDYITFIDGDDFINENMLQSLVDGLEADVDILFSDQWNENEYGEFVAAKSIVDYGVYSGEEFIKNIFSDHMLHFMFPKLYKKEFLVNAGYIDFPHITTGEDLLTNTCLGLHNPKVKYIDSVNYYYRFNQSSVTRKENPGLFQQISTLEWIEEYFKRNSAYEDYKLYIDYAWYSYVMLYLQYPFSTQFKKELVSKCRKHLIDYENNSICVKSRSEHSKVANLIFDMYVKESKLCEFVDSNITAIRKLKRKMRK